jgi:hypothetical protein
MRKLPDNKILEIEKGVSFGMASGSIIEITKKETEPDSLSSRAISSMPWAIWGKDNNYPQRIIDENMQDTTSAGALEFKIKAHYGKGIFFYREEVDAKGIIKQIPILLADLPAEIQDFYYRNDLPNLVQGIVQDFEWFNFYYVEYILNGLRNRIDWIKWQRTKDARIGKRNANSGEVPLFYLSAYWPKPKKGEYKEVPAFNRLRPFALPNAVYKHQLVSVDKDYYPTPRWHSNTRWLSISVKVAKWINANIDNAVNIKYHVEIPEKYFLDLYPRDRYESDEEWMKVIATKEAEIKENIDKCLAGAENAQKIFYTKIAIDSQGNALPGWKITVLPNDIKDGAWLNADATAASRITSGHSVDPTLSGLRTGNSLQVGSGSDMREKFNFHMQLHTTIGRQTTTEWWDIVSRSNKWDPKIRIGYRDVYLETLDNAKTGVKTQNEESPTSPGA